MQWLKKHKNRSCTWKHTIHSPVYLVKDWEGTLKNTVAGEVWTLSKVNMKAQKISAEMMLFQQNSYMLMLGNTYHTTYEPVYFWESAVIPQKLPTAISWVIAVFHLEESTTVLKRQPVWKEGKAIQLKQHWKCAALTGKLSMESGNLLS